MEILLSVLFVIAIIAYVGCMYMMCKTIMNAPDTSELRELKEELRILKAQVKMLQKRAIHETSERLRNL